MYQKEPKFSIWHFWFWTKIEWTNDTQTAMAPNILKNLKKNLTDEKHFASSSCKKLHLTVVDFFREFYKLTLNTSICKP